MIHPRVFLSQSPLDQKTPFVWHADNRESHHLRNVLRLREGHPLLAFDGNGRTWNGKIMSLSQRTGVTLLLTSISHVEPIHPRRVLVLAMPKQKAWENSLRMASEIGISHIVPIISDHCEVRLQNQQLDNKLEKWQLLLIEAAKQCGLNHLPTIESPVLLETWLNNQVLPIHGFLCSLEANTPYLLDSLCQFPKTPISTIHAVIGPEGDFTKNEYTILQQAGLTPIRLANQVLRCDTAVAYSLAAIDQFFLSHT
jgi:16S rRNA (uracil1498-N3)-methyltransferase